MAESKVGYILGLIGGILGVIGGIIFLAFAGALAGIAAIIPFAGFFGALASGVLIALAIWYIVSGALVIWFSTWMKDPKRCRKGGIWVLVLSIVGSGGILGLIGGIFGIVQGGK